MSHIRDEFRHFRRMPRARNGRQLTLPIAGRNLAGGGIDFDRKLLLKSQPLQVTPRPALCLWVEM